MTIMKKSAYLVAIAAQFALSTPPAAAQSAIDNALPLSDINIIRRDSRLVLRMNLDARELHPSTNREYLITPVLIADNKADSAVFTSVLISGRNLYMRHVRNNDLDSVSMYQSGKHDNISYSASVPLHKWMDNATLHIRSQRKVCCNKVATVYNDEVAMIRRAEFDSNKFLPPYICQQSETAKDDSVKIFDLHGRAYVNFPVNRTELYPDYMSNPAELRRITATIDSIKDDPDITILSISIKGFASPEGKYALNARLAKDRTTTLADYVGRLYSFPKGFIETDHMAEDWEGLRTYVEQSALTNRDGLLRIIDSDLQPDDKDARLKADFPTEYQHLLGTVYPSLRHSDYVINYRVRSYSKIDEIISVLKTAPQKLSREELYRAARSMQPGSEEYIYLVETAVRMYPDDEVWNYNAANAAMHRGSYDEASRYLAKAGDKAAAIYARGVLAALQKRYDEAEPLLSRAAQMGDVNAPAALSALRDVRSYGDGNVRIIRNK